MMLQLGPYKVTEGAFASSRFILAALLALLTGTVKDPPLLICSFEFRSTKLKETKVFPCSETMLYAQKGEQKLRLSKEFSCSCTHSGKGSKFIALYQQMQQCWTYKFVCKITHPIC